VSGSSIARLPVSSGSGNDYVAEIFLPNALSLHVLLTLRSKVKSVPEPVTLAR